MKKKRIFALLLALALLLLTVSACGAAKEEPLPPADFPPFPATLLEIRENSFLILADEGADVRRSSDLFQVGIADAQLLDEEGNPLSTLLELHLYDRLEVAFTGGIDESYPAQAAASKITRLPKVPLTREDLLTLAQRAEELDWTDFAPYQSTEVGSGLYILRFEIDEDYYLMIGGVPQESPWYIRLCRAGSEEWVELLDEDFSIDQLFAEGEAMAPSAEGEVMAPSAEGEATAPSAKEEVMAPSAEGETVASSSAGDYPAAIRVAGKIYHLYQPMPAEIDPSAILGETTSYTDTWPSEDGQTNFSRTLGLPYAQVEDGIAVLYENEWWFCYEVK